MADDETGSGGSLQAFAVLWERKALIGLLVAGATALAAASLRFIEPRYEAEALVALNTRSSAAEALLTTKPMVASPPITSVVVSTEMDILESRGLAAMVVDALALQRDPELNPLLEPGLIRRFVKASEDRDPRTLTIDTVMRRLTVKSDPESYVIRVSFESGDPAKAALIANAFADLYIRRQRQAKLEEMQVATDWISGQIAALRGELAEDAGDAVAFRRTHELDPVDGREPGLVLRQQMVALSDELATVERERAEAETSLAQARRLLKRGGNAVALTFVEESPFLQELRKEEARLLAHIAELSAGYQPGSPVIATLAQQLASLRGEIDSEIRRQVDMIANKAAQAKARQDALEARIAQISAGARRSDQAVTELELRQREIEAKNLMLESFLSRFAELTDRTEIGEPDARIASRATPPSKPSFPKPFLFLGVAFGGSLGLSVSLAFLLERFRTGFLSTRQIRDALDLPTLGILPDISRLPLAGLPGDYLVDRPESVYAEAVRSAQIAIMNARGAGDGKGILVTSSVPAEGKSAFTVSLGRSLALSGRKVAVVDCDLRRPSVARQIGAYEIPGLSDYLRQQASVDEVIRHDGRSGLDFVASGGRVTDPQRLLEDDAVRTLFRILFDRYDLVLLDSPPTMVAADTALLADLVDFAVYVVEWDRTPRRAVEAGVGQLRTFSIPVGGVVLTKVDLGRQQQHGDYVDFCFRDSEYYGN